MSARRQVVACVAQCDAWGGAEDESLVLLGLVRRYPGGPHGAELTRGARLAAAAYLELGAWLRQEYLPGASRVDPVGRDYTASAARYFTGSELDLEDTYRVRLVRAASHRSPDGSSVRQIAPGASLPEVIDQLEADPDRVIDGVDAFQAWNQDLIDATISSLDGVHFDIAEPIRRCEAMIAPPGGAAAMYYTAPERGLLPRPGAPGTRRSARPASRCGGKSRSATTRAFPAITCRSPRCSIAATASTAFSAWPRSLPATAKGGRCTPSASWASWAISTIPRFELGMLAAQAMRAVRVIVDIGMHLELPIPADEAYHPASAGRPSWPCRS